jgi:hypothetical protein
MREIGTVVVDALGRMGRDIQTAYVTDLEVLKAFFAAQLGNAVIAPQPFEHDADLVFGREMAPGLPPDILHHPLRMGLFPAIPKKRHRLPVPRAAEQSRMPWHVGANC